MDELAITEFTDPGCPFAWSAEPIRRRLEWLFGDQLRWGVRMVGMSEHSSDGSESGFTPERHAQTFHALSERYGMPMDTAVRPRLEATLPACRAVVATRLHDPERARSLLRALRVRNFAGELLDEQRTLEGAALDTDIDPAQLARWMGEAATERALEDDLDKARHPSREALALRHKLAKWSGGLRYGSPSYEIVHTTTGAHLAVPGFQPLECYEVAIANLLPSAHRRANPENVAKVLAWAGEPLASVEVARVCEIEPLQAREQLSHVAHERPVGFDGLWSLTR
jgi:predicted DsbA family dithiol-disulfide isomerase